MPSALDPAKPLPLHSPSRPPGPSLTHRYLLLYNLLSLAAWTAILFRLLFTLLTHTIPIPIPGISDSEGSTFTTSISSLSDFVRLVQTLALLEILHAALGWVRAGVVVTGMQVASRLLLVWSITYPLVFREAMFGRSPEDGPRQRRAARTTVVAGTGGIPAAVWYTMMALAWSVTEFVRYGYFVATLSRYPSVAAAGGDANSSSGSGTTVQAEKTKAGEEDTTVNAPSSSSSRGGSKDGVPAWLLYLRYNTFYILYPLGISSECALIYHASRIASSQERLFPRDNLASASASAPELAAAVRAEYHRRRFWVALRWTLWAVLAVYIPGSYVLYTHMMRQRGKVFGRGGGGGGKAKR